MVKLSDLSYLLWTIYDGKITVHCLFKLQNIVMNFQIYFQEHVLRK